MVKINVHIIFTTCDHEVGTLLNSDHGVEIDDRGTYEWKCRSVKNKEMSIVLLSMVLSSVLVFQLYSYLLGLLNVANK
jgi:hypothetical protein